MHKSDTHVFFCAWRMAMPGMQKKVVAGLKPQGHCSALAPIPAWCALHISVAVLPQAGLRG